MEWKVEVLSLAMMETTIVWHRAGDGPFVSQFGANGVTVFRREKSYDEKLAGCFGRS